MTFDPDVRKKGLGHAFPDGFHMRGEDACPPRHASQLDKGFDPVKLDLTRSK